MKSSFVRHQTLLILLFMLLIQEILTLLSQCHYVCEENSIHQHLLCFDTCSYKKVNSSINNSCFKQCKQISYQYVDIFKKYCPKQEKNAIKNNNKTQICVLCSQPCLKQSIVNFQSNFINQGKLLQHQISFQHGLQLNHTLQYLEKIIRIHLVVRNPPQQLLYFQNNAIIQNLKSQYSNKLTHLPRLLLKIQLMVQFLQITKDFNAVKLSTLNPYGNLTVQEAINSGFQIQFVSPIVDRRGIPYSRISGKFNTNQRIFVQSFFKQKGKDSYMYAGIILCAFSALILFLSIFCFYDKKISNEIMAFIMTIQIVGLIRMKASNFPYMDLSWILYGFSQLQFNFIPNVLDYAYVDGYLQNVYPSIGLTYDNQSLFSTWGSTFEVGAGLQIIYLLYILQKRYNKQKSQSEESEEQWQRAKSYQHQILSLILVKTIFSCLFCISSFNINSQLDSISKLFWFAQLCSMIFIILYMIYLYKHFLIVKKQIKPIKNTMSNNNTINNDNHNQTKEFSHNKSKSNHKQLDETLNQMNKFVNLEQNHMCQSIANLQVKDETQQAKQNNIQAKILEINQNRKQQFTQVQVQLDPKSIKAIVKKTLQPYRAYKIFNFLKVISIMIIVAERSIAGIILLNIIQLLSFLFQVYFFRQEKYNFKFYVVQFGLTLLAFNSACLINRNTPLLLFLLIVSMYGMLFIKGYYVIMRLVVVYRQKFPKKENQQQENIENVQIQQQTNQKGQNQNIEPTPIKVIPKKTFFQDGQQFSYQPFKPELFQNNEQYYQENYDLGAGQKHQLTSYKQQGVRKNQQTQEQRFYEQKNPSKNNQNIFYRQQDDIDSQAIQNLQRQLNQFNSDIDKDGIIYKGNQFYKSDLLKLTQILREKRKNAKKKDVNNMSKTGANFYTRRSDNQQHIEQDNKNHNSIHVQYLSNQSQQKFISYPIILSSQRKHDQSPQNQNKNDYQPLQNYTKQTKSLQENKVKQRTPSQSSQSSSQSSQSSSESQKVQKVQQSEREQAQVIQNQSQSEIEQAQVYQNQLVQNNQVKSKKIQESSQQLDQGDKDKQQQKKIQESKQVVFHEQQQSSSSSSSSSQDS